MRKSFDGRQRSTRLRRGAIARATGCSDASSSAPAKRSASSRVVPSVTVTSTRLIRPRGDRAGLVEDDRVDRAGRLEDLRPPDQEAELSAAAGADHQRRGRGQAERARAGDDQHGDGGGERVGARSRRARARRPALPPTARSRPARTRLRRGRRAAEPAPCPACASVTSRAIWATAVSAPTLVARTTSRPPAFTVAPGDLGARARPRPARTRR